MDDIEPTEISNPVDQYFYTGELAKGKMVKNFTDYGLEYEIEVLLELKETLDIPGWMNLITVTKGGDNLELGDRLPSIYLNEDGWYISTGLNEQKSYGLTFLHEIGDYLINVSQRKYGNDYIYKIAINGEEKHEKVNSEPKSFEEVTVYLSDPWHFSFNDTDVLIHFIKMYQWA